MQLRSLFLSDVHLGNRGCQAALLARFLDSIRTDNLFLVGDIIDFEAMEERFYWHRSHTEILRAVLAAARRGTRVVYIPGNHDHRMRAWCGRRLGRIEVERFWIHTAADQRRYLLLHGDEFDGLLACGRWLSWLASVAYRTAIRINTRLNRRRHENGHAYLPLASVLKHRLGSARHYMNRFRETVVETAEGLAVDGVICGHIHRPEVVAYDHLEYLNTGDWVESCTAIAEHPDGRMELIRASEHLARSLRPPGLRRLAA